jgi:hypothetical protein
MSNSVSQNAAPQAPSPRRVTGFDVVRVVLGLVILAAAALKTHELATRPAKNLNILSYRWSLALLVEVQIVLGLWWLSGLYRRLAWLAALVCFTFFTGVTIYEGLAGYESCGCFGAVEVHPWYTLVFDVCAVVALLVFRPDLSRARPASRRKLRLGLVAALAVVGGVAALAAIASFEPARVSDTGEIVGGQDTAVVVEPETWRARPFPLLKHIDVGERLRTGQWEVLLYRWDCESCHRVIEQKEPLAAMMGGPSEAGGIALISIPPHAPPGREMVGEDSPFLVGKLSDAHDWFIGTPTVLSLADGVVMEVQAEPAAPSPPAPATGAASQPATAPVPLGTPPPVVETSPNPATNNWTAEHHFGYLPTNVIAPVIVRVQNTMDEDLVLKKIVSRCHCSAFMSIPDPPRVIPAGETGDIRIVLTTPPDARRIAQWATLFTENERPEKIVCRITADVGTPLKIEPRIVDLGRRIAGEAGRGRFTVLNRGRKPVRLREVSFKLEGATVYSPSTTVPPGGETEVSFHVPSLGRAPGLRHIYFDLFTDCPEQERLEGAVKFRISPVFEVEPGVIELGEVSPGSSHDAEVRVTGRFGGEFLRSAKVADSRNLDAELRSGYEEGAAVLRCRLRAGRRPGAMDGTIELELDRHHQPVRVYVTGYVAAAETAASD